MDYWNSDEVAMEGLIGKTFISVVNSDDESITFTDTDGLEYVMFHSQDCCESVNIEDICGDLQDLVDTPIVDARENTSDINPIGIKPEYQDSFTWTFYDFATIKGTVTIRWYGESNGYYSESVDFRKASVQKD